MIGERMYRRGGEMRRYRYHLSPRFCVRRDIAPDFMLQIRPGLYLTDLAGRELPARTRNSRRKQLCRSWWNHEWLNRHFALVGSCPTVRNRSQWARHRKSRSCLRRS